MDYIVQGLPGSTDLLTLYMPNYFENIKNDVHFLSFLSIKAVFAVESLPYGNE